MTSNHPRYKFLTRNLRLSDSAADKDTSADTSAKTTALAFRQVLIKSFYLKNLIYSRKDEDVNMFLTLKRKKASKTFRKITISVIAQTPFDECLKTAKNLKNFCIDSQNNNSNPHKILQTLRKLPFQIEKIAIQIFQEGSINVQNLYKISSSLGRFPKLHYFQRHYSVKRIDVEKETRILSKSTSRLKSLKAIDYKMSYKDLKSFQQTMKNDFVYSQIHGLRIAINAELLENFSIFEEFLKFDNSIIDKVLNDKIVNDYFVNFDTLTKAQSQAYKRLLNDLKENKINMTDLLSGVDAYVKKGVSKDFIMKCLMREEIMPCYRFEMFPNLRKLDIIKEGYEYPLGSFVIDAFESLKNLKELNIKMCGMRSHGTIYILQGLLKLPLLQRFKLRIPFLKNEDWEIFGKFINKQKSLEIFGFEIMRNPMNPYEPEQNQHLKEFLKNLQNKPLLKHLELKSFYFSPYTLSEGLESLNLKLQTLKIETSDEGFDCPKKPIKAVQGLCQFIKNQNESLRNLDLYLENDFLPIKTIFSSITKLIHLKTLNLSISLPQKVDLVSFLHRLKNLENFTFEFAIDDDDDDEVEEGYIWFIEMLRKLAQLQNLRYIEIKTTGDGFSFDFQDQVAGILYHQMKYIKEIKFSIWNAEAGFQHFDELFEMIDYVNQRQSCKSEFIF